MSSDPRKGSPRSKSSAPRRGTSTEAVHAGGPHPEPGAPVIHPVVQSATFFGGTGRPGEVLRYSRYGNNPNQEAVAAKMAALEGTPAALALASGMAATALSIMAAARSGDHVVASKHLYGKTRSFLTEELPRRGVEVTLVDPDDPRAWSSAMRAETRVLFLEIPTNPTLRLFDPRPVARVADGARVVFMVDATFASPVNLRPGELGADVVIHSATKYLGGHSDLIAGVVCGPEDLVSEVKRLLKVYGPALDPHAAWLLERGIKTLDVRVRRQNENALALARWLADQPEVASVVYPGLEDHPDHGLAVELMEGFGGMLAFVLSGGGPAADRMCAALDVAMQAPSLGGVETLVSQPRYTSHVDLPPADRAAMGIPDGFVRVSVGIENVEDLQADFRQALDVTGDEGAAG